MAINIQSRVENRQVETTPQGLALGEWLTVERALYGLLLLLAVGLRGFMLTNQPLNSLEATNVWTAWLTATGNTVATGTSPTSPLFHSLYMLLFWALDGGDWLARLLPVCFGSATVLLLWYWRIWLGRNVALIAAALIAFDPWLIAYSRLADSAGLSLFLGMLVLTALIQLATQPADEEVAPHWHYLAAVGFCLLVISGPQMWNWLPVLAIFVISIMPLARTQALLAARSAWLLGLGLALVGATGWLAEPATLGMLSSSLSAWLRGWSGDQTMNYPVSWFWLRLFVEAGLLVVFGLVGLLTRWRGSATAGARRWNRFLLAWLLWGLLLALVPGRSPLILAMVGLPLIFLAAEGINGLWQDARAGVSWRENGLLISVLAILFLSFCFWLAAFSNNVQIDALLARTLIIIIVLMLLLILAFVLWVDGRQARLVTGSGVGLVLVLWTLSSGWALNHHFDLRYPDGFFATYTNPDVERLAAAVETLSAQRAGDASDMPIQVEMTGTPDPLLGWYLRTMRNLQWVLAPGLVDGQSPTVVITFPDSQGVDQLTTDYVGSSYALHDRWLPSDLLLTESPPAPVEGSFSERLQAQLNNAWTGRVRILLRWMIYHKTPTLPPQEEVILWVASEAAE